MSQGLPRRIAIAAALLLAAVSHAQQPFTLQQVLSAPYASTLSASPVGARFAWVEDAEGVHNLWVAGPNEAARKLTHYTEDDAQDITGLAWAPDGNTIAYTYGAETGASGRPANPAHLQRNTALHIILQPLDPALKPTDIGEGRSALFSRDGKSLLFLRAGSVWITDLATHEAHQLVFDRGSASSLTLSPKGHQLAYVSHRKVHSLIGLYTFANKTLRFLTPSSQIDTAPAFSPDGRQIAFLRHPVTEDAEFENSRSTAMPWSIVVANVDDTEGRTVFTAEPNKPGSVVPRMATGDPKVMWTAEKKLLFANEADGWVHLYSLDPASNAPPTLLTPGNFEVEDASLDRQGRVLLWSSSAKTKDDPLDADRRHIWQLSLTEPGATPKWRTAGAGNETHSISAADGSAVVALASNNRPMHPVLLQPNGAHTPLDAQRTNPAADSLTPPGQVLFDAADGIHLHAQLFEPKKTSATAKRPAIIFVHGGPKRQMLLGYPSMDYYSNAYAMNQYLASRGFIVLSVNYRGGIGYGLDFRQSEHQGANGAAEYNDVLAAQKYLASRPDVDAKRIGIWGGSYGGYLTALALARNSDLFAAGVDFHGVHEWALEDNAPADWLHGPPDNPTIPAALAAKAHASSPMADVDKWRSPVLLIHGDDDPEVTFAQTPLLADALRARKVPVEELIFPDEVHGFLLHKDWLAAYEATAAFFERTLKPAAK